MKKTLSQRHYQFLKDRLEEVQDQKVIDENQKTMILDQYEMKERLDFVQVVVTIGAILMGLGAILFVSSNWEVIPNLLKVIILWSAIIISLGFSYTTKKTSINVSKALLYLTILIFGASLFLIDLAYQFNIESYTLIFIWTLATLVLSAIHKDVLLFIFAHVLTGFFILIGFESFIFIQAIILVGLLFLGIDYFNFKKLLIFGSLTVLQILFLYTFDYMSVEPLIRALFFLSEGLILYYTKFSSNKDITEFSGLLLIGAASFSLTFPFIYEEAFLIENGSFISLPFTLVLIIYLFTLIEKNKLTPLLIIAVLIVRFYADTFYDTLPRSLFFIIGGAMMLGMGIFIERRRRSLNENH